VVYVLSIAAALASATAGVLQRIGIESAPAESQMSLRLIVHGLKRGIWVLGFVLLLATFGLQASALRFGDLSTVQPVLTLELLFLIVILATVFRRPVGWRDWTGMLGIVLGLGAFLVIASPRQGHGVPRSGPLGLATGIIAVAALSLAIAGRRGPRWWRAVALGLGAGSLFAYNAAVTKVTTTLITMGWGHVFTHWEPYMVPVVGSTGFFLLQNALHAGPIAASRAAMVIVNPLVSIIVGVSVLGERMRTGGADLAGEVAALLVLCAAIAVLSRSPLVSGTGAGGGAGELLAAAEAPIA
jgi:drug/metabolite transporter (DMT)-like permease